MADARALAPLMTGERRPLPCSTLYVYLLLEPPTAGWKPGCGSRVIALEMENYSEEDEVRFALSEGGVDMSAGLPRATGDIESLFLETFGFRPDRTAHGFLIGSRAHDVESLLSEFAGYATDDLDLRWPE
jgi:hypothetical protein